MQDEVLAISEKVVLRVEDLITWITVDAEWTWGRLGNNDSEVQPPENQEDEGKTQFRDCSLDLSDVEKEKRLLDSEWQKKESRYNCGKSGGFNFTSSVASLMLLLFTTQQICK